MKPVAFRITSKHGAVHINTKLDNQEGRKIEPLYAIPAGYKWVKESPSESPALIVNNCFAIAMSKFDARHQPMEFCMGFHKAMIEAAPKIEDI